MQKSDTIKVVACAILGLLFPTITLIFTYFYIGYVAQKALNDKTFTPLVFMLWPIGLIMHDETQAPVKALFDLGVDIKFQSPIVISDRVKKDELPNE